MAGLKFQKAHVDLLWPREPFPREALTVARLSNSEHVGSREYPDDLLRVALTHDRMGEIGPHSQSCSQRDSTVGVFLDLLSQIEQDL